MTQWNLRKGEKGVCVCVFVCWRSQLLDLDLVSHALAPSPPMKLHLFKFSVAVCLLYG